MNISGLDQGYESEAVLETVLMAGELTLTSGGEIFRVEETIERMGRAWGMFETEAFATPTGIMVTLRDSRGRTLTAVRRIREPGIDLARLAELNDLARRVEQGFLGLADARRTLESLKASGPRPSLFRRPAVAGLASLTFTYLFGGSLLEVAWGGLAGLVVYLTPGSRINRFFRAFFGGTVAGAFGVTAAALGSGVSADLVITGAIMPLVPGLAITNAIRDLIAEDLISAGARGLGAVLVALSIAAGVAAVLAPYLRLGGVLQ
jgi:uncharacterized membrane protein YjjP (DUF1212 family)